MLSSLTAQTEQDFEIIAVDDGSTDATSSVLADFAAHDSRMQVIVQENRGCAAARARAQSEASGRYLTQIDADDALSINYCEAMKRFIIDNPEHEFYSCNATMYRGLVSRPFLTQPRFLSTTSIELDDLMDECNLLGGGSCLNREWALNHESGFKEGTRIDDYAMFIDVLLKGGRHLYNPQRLYDYYFGTPGHMNEDQRITFASFVEVLERADATLAPNDARHAVLAKGIAHYEERTTDDYLDRVAVGDRVAEQTGRVLNIINNRVPACLQKPLIRTLAVLKKPIDPLRVAADKRRLAKERDHD